MNEWLRIINGNVPGGLFLLFLVLVVYSIVNVYLLKVSPFFTRRLFLKWMLIGFGTILAIYFAIWRLHPPYIPPDRYVVGPVIAPDEDTSIAWSEWLRLHFPEEKNRDVVLTSWIWIYPSAYRIEKESKMTDLQKKIQSLRPDGHLYGRLIQNDPPVLMLILARNGHPKDSVEIPPGQPYMEVLERWLARNRIPLKPMAGPSVDQYQYQLAGKLAVWYYDHDYERVFRFVQSQSLSPDNSLSMIWIMKCLAGSQLAYRQKELSPPKNPLESRKTGWEQKFAESRTELLKIVREHPSDIEALNALAFSFILEEKFGYADALLKQASTITSYHFRVFYLLSFLHPSRLKEIHFRDEEDVLERAYYLNPIDEYTISRYARTIFDNSLPTSSRKKFAIRLVEKYLGKNPYSLAASKQLAYFYMYSNQPEKAIPVYHRMLTVRPGDDTIRFDLAIALQEAGKFGEAIPIFTSLMNKPGFEDAHAYLGKIYRDEGNYEMALKHFRLRVMAKKGEEDPIALECMKGIRQILQEMEEKGIMHENHSASDSGK